MHISKLEIITTESTPEQTQQEGVYTNRLHDNPDQNKADHNNAEKQSITQSELQHWSTPAPSKKLYLQERPSIAPNVVPALLEVL